MSAQIDLVPMGTAIYSPCRRYRYELTRRWGSGGPCVFLMLNPSTATEFENDPTVRRAIGFAQAWGFGALTVLNLFALRSTDPAALRKVEDPVGPDNDETIRRVAAGAGALICAWGVHGRLFGRDRAVGELLADVERRPPLECLGSTLGGEPKHPLYLRNDARRVLYMGWR